MNKLNSDDAPQDNASPDDGHPAPAPNFGEPPSFLVEFRDFLIHSPGWWLAPIVIILIVFALTIALIPREAMPFIYTLW